MQTDNFIYDNLENFNAVPSETCEATPTLPPAEGGNGYTKDQAEKFIKESEPYNGTGRTSVKDVGQNYYTKRFEKDLLSFGTMGGFSAHGLGNSTMHNAQSALLGIILIVLPSILLFSEGNNILNFITGKSYTSSELMDVPMWKIIAPIWVLTMCIYIILDMSILVSNHCKIHYEDRYKKIITTIVVLASIIGIIAIGMFINITSRITIINYIFDKGNLPFLIMMCTIITFIVAVILKYTPRHNTHIYTSCKKGYYAAPNYYGEISKCIPCSATTSENNKCYSSGEIGETCKENVIDNE